MLILRSAVLEALAFASRVSGQITEDMKLVHLAPAGGQLSVYATDYDLSLRCLCDVDAQIPQIALPAKQFHDSVKSLGEEIAFEIDGTRVKLSSGGARFSLPFVEAVAPKAPEELAVLKATVKHADFVSALEAQLPLIPAHTDSKWQIQGIRIRVSPGFISIAATDGVRAGISVRPCDSEHAHEFIISRKAANEVHGLVRDSDEDVRLYWADSALSFGIGSNTLACKLLSGSFPAGVDSILKLVPEKTVKVESAPLIEAARRARIVAENEYSTTALAFKDGLLQLCCESPNGRFEQEVPVDFTGEMTFKLNARTFAELVSIRKGVIELGYSGDRKPVTLRNGAEGDIYAMATIAPVPVKQ